MAKSDYLENNLLEYVLRNGVFASPGVVYLALFTTALVDSDTSVQFPSKEVADAIGYTRLVAAFDAPVGNQVSNTSDLLFGVATSDWGTIVHFGIMDSSAWGAGNLLYHAPLTAPRTILTGDELRFSAGQLIISES